MWCSYHSPEFPLELVTKIPPSVSTYSYTWGWDLHESSQVKSIHKHQTTIRKPIECAPEASSGGT